MSDRKTSMCSVMWWGDGKVLAEAEILDGVQEYAFSFEGEQRVARRHKGTNTFVISGDAVARRRAADGKFGDHKTSECAITWMGGRVQETVTIADGVEAYTFELDGQERYARRIRGTNEFVIAGNGPGGDFRIQDALNRLSNAEKDHNESCADHFNRTNSVHFAKQALVEAEAQMVAVEERVAVTFSELTAARKAVISAARETK